MPAPIAQAPSCAPGRSPTLLANAAALNFGRLTGPYQINSLQQRRDAQRIQAVKIEAAQGIGIQDVYRLLQQDRASIEAVVRPENGQSRLRLTPDDRPVNGTGTAMPRQQRRVILDGAMRGEV